jgi:hypothetical protein
MNLTEDHQVTGFTQTFIEMHDYYYSPHVFTLIVGSTLVTAIFLAISFRLRPIPANAVRFSRRRRCWFW